MLEGDAAYRHFSERTPTPSAEEATMGERFTNGYSGVVNGHLRNSPYSNNEFRKKNRLPLITDESRAKAQYYTDTLSSMIKRTTPTTEATQLHRGVTRSNTIFGPVGSMKGTTFVDPGFSHTTTDPSNMKSFTHGSSPAHLHITAPAGSQGLTYSKNNFQKEKEVTLHPRSRFHIDDDYLDSDGLRQVHATLLGHD